MAAFSIREFEHLSGVKAHTIRIWEQRYHFLRPNRTAANFRSYTSEELATILDISLLHKYGYRISHIDRMQKEEVEERLAGLSTREACQERQVNELLKAMSRLDVPGFDGILDHETAEKGIDKTITQLIGPFLHKIGNLWGRNRLQPAQDLLVGQSVRRKLVRGLEEADPAARIHQTILLFLPEGEYHETGLLFASYLMKSHGISILYLGASVPLKDLEFVANLKKPNCLFTHLSAEEPDISKKRFLASYKIRCGAHPLVISGLTAPLHGQAMPEKLSCILSITGLQDFIASLR